ncbi:hypothetical protein GPECTOR_25g305 [Gonium pectorale]|uniref:BACK domain-containing protein n=1 Tax=Gonium pectorale TaxID=33097 RepID=A0A150GFW0_GONPE|nr:hypothetical protein GPECTOR_25g305 [Gonium pectorale]|eukprot:KXZ48722.1 hypothetical protein GPECTOR_25g305 [Gonium pectorale]
MLEAEPSDDDALSPVIDLYSYIPTRWPDPAHEPHLAAVLAAARPRLVGHFGDALAALNTPALRRQLLALPAAGLEALLESDDFGTDAEESILLLLLAAWVEENGGDGDDGDPEIPISRAGGCGWFPISFAEAIHLVSLCTPGALERQRVRLQEAAGRWLPAPQGAWFSTTPRRQCLPVRLPRPSGGASPLGSSSQQQQQQPPFERSISQAELERALRELLRGGELELPGVLDNGRRPVAARGFEWRPVIKHEHGAAAAGLCLRFDLPGAYHLAQEACLGGPLSALAQLGARAGGEQCALRPTDGWGEYLHDGSIWGRLTLVPL